MERSERGTRHHLPLGPNRLVAGIFGRNVDEGCDAGVARRDPFEERVDDLDRREIPAADPAGHLGGA